MTISEAEKIIRKFYENPEPSEDDRFLYTEALSFLIEETKDPVCMNNLGAFYYEQKEFDLALKYYEMAAEAGNLYAISNLGYIFYYGRTGKKDYEKAFYWFAKAREMGDLVAAYKVADMYKNGYYVEKDYEKYKSIIEDLYDKVQYAYNVTAPLPEIFTRLAGIRVKEGKPDEALRLYDVARDFLARRIKAHPFFGDLTVMKGIIHDIYRLRKFDRELIRLYDLYYLLDSPGQVKFTCNGAVHEIAAVKEEGVTAVCFDEKWYRTIDDFFVGAVIDGQPLTSRYEELYDFEVM